MSIKNRDQLENLDHKKQLVFAYLVCERLYPNYVYFSDNFNFGNKQILRESINLIYKVLLYDSAKEKEIQSFLSQVDINTPYPHNFETILSSSALDACTSVLETLDFILDKDVSRLKNISTYATDTVDMYIAGSENLDFNNDPDFESKIFNHPLMQKEFAIQKRTISYLNQIDQLELLDINYLLELQYNDGKSNIGF